METLPKTEIFKGLSQSDRASTSKDGKDIDKDQILQVLDSKSVHYRKHDFLTFILTCNILVSKEIS